MRTRSEYPGVATPQKTPGALMEKLTTRECLMNFAHVLQTSLFPVIAEETGPLSVQAKLLMQVLAMAPLGPWLSPTRGPGQTAGGQNGAGGSLCRQSSLRLHYHPPTAVVPASRRAITPPVRLDACLCRAS